MVQQLRRAHLMDPGRGSLARIETGVERERPASSELDEGMVRGTAWERQCGREMSGESRIAWREAVAAARDWKWKLIIQPANVSCEMRETEEINPKTACLSDPFKEKLKKIKSRSKIRDLHGFVVFVRIL